jgi:hypothetical protein
MLPALPLCVLGLTSCSRAATPDHVPAERPARDLASCELPTDSVRYVVMLDHSGSMRPQWSAVRSQLAAITDSIPDGSWLRITLFSGRITTGVPDFQLRSGTRTELRTTLAQLPEPRANAPTDIGLALSEAADIVEAGSRRWGVTFLFVLTDGKHQAPPTSRFRGSDSDAWRAVRQRWSGLDQSAAGLYSFVIPIAEHSDQTDVGLVGAVVPYSVVLGPTAAGRVGSVVGEEIGRAKRSLLNARVAREVAAPRLDARLASDPQPVAMFRRTASHAVLRSQAACVTYAVTPVGVTTADGDLHASNTVSDAPVLVPPGASASVPLRMRSRASLPGLWPWARHAPVRLTSTAGLSLELNVAGEPDSALLRLAVDPRGRKLSLPVAGTVQPQSIGMPTFVALVLAGLGVLALVWSFFRAPAFTLTPWGKMDALPLSGARPRIPVFGRSGRIDLDRAVRLNYERSRLFSRSSATYWINVDSGAGADIVVVDPHGGTSTEPETASSGRLPYRPGYVVLWPNADFGSIPTGPLPPDAENRFGGYRLSRS